MHNISAGKMAYAILPALLLYQSMQEKLPVASSLYPYSLIIKILSVLTSLTNNSIDTSCSNHK